MKLRAITESLSEKYFNVGKRLVTRTLGDVIPAIDQAYDYILAGTRRQNLLLDDEKWWEGLFKLLWPIDPEALNALYDDTVRYVIDLLQRQRQAYQPQVATEGILRNIGRAILKIALYLLRAWLETGTNYGYGRGGQTQLQRIGTINSLTASYFVDRVETYVNTNREQLLRVRQARETANEPTESPERTAPQSQPQTQASSGTSQATQDQSATQAPL